MIRGTKSFLGPKRTPYTPDAAHTCHSATVRPCAASDPVALPNSKLLLVQHHFLYKLTVSASQDIRERTPCMVYESTEECPVSPFGVHPYFAS